MSRILLRIIRVWWVCGLCSLTIQGWHPPTTAAELTLHDRIQPLIAEFRGQAAIAVKHLPSGDGYLHRADELMPTASLIKFPIMVETFSQVHGGNLDLDVEVVLSEADKVPGSGILTANFSPGTKFKLRDLVRLMIVFSDNTATNLVIDQVGLPATNQRMDAFGCPNTRLYAKVFRRDTSLNPERSRQFGLGSTTANEMLGLLERLVAGKLVSQDASQQMLQLLYACDDRTKIPRLLPDQVKVAHKTGAVAKSRCDAGIIEGPTGPIAICVLTTDNEDLSWSDDNRANLFCAQVARAAYDYFNSGSEVSSDAFPELTSGAQGWLVEVLQRTLKARLGAELEISTDGDFGPQTAAAVMRFQQARGLEPTGRVGRATWQALGPLVEDEPTVPAPEVVNAMTIPRSPADPIVGPPIVSCRAWGILDGTTGDMLWSHNEEEPLDPASTTKIMTALVALQCAAANPELLNEMAVVSERADATVGSTAGLRAGESLPLAELLYALLLPSGNDAAVVVAEHVGQSRVSEDDKSGQFVDPLERFVQMMNQTASQLGLRETNYRNPHGLTAPGHLTSVRDLARLAWRAMQDPLFREVVGVRQRGYRVSSARGYTRNLIWKNTNQLLGIEGFHGIKTGTTQAAGACLVSCGERNGRQLIVVTLGSASSQGRYVDTRNLYRWAWERLLPSQIEASSTQAAAAARQQPVRVTEAALTIHRQALLVDGHNDLPWRYRDMGMPSFEQVDIRLPQPDMHTDIPRLLQGGVGAQFWSVYVPVETSHAGRALLTTLEQIELVHAMVRRYPDVFRLALTHDEILACRREGKIACLIGVEGGHSIEDSLNVLRQLYERGARYMTLTHSETLAWADSATDESRHGGLSEFGEEVVREMNRLGMLVDLSHVSEATMDDALDVTRAPVIFSHSSARAIADHPRNVPDRILQRVARNGGVVMINFYPSFVVPAAAQRSIARSDHRRLLASNGQSADNIAQAMVAWEARHPIDRGSIYDVVDHIDHVVRQAGIDHVGLGSDYDGIDSVPAQLEDVSTYPRITQELLNRGYTAEQIHKILGGNLLRVLKAAEHVAASVPEKAPTPK